MRVPVLWIRATIIAAIGVQLWYILEPRFGPYPYRARERALAGIERAERPSPEAESAWRREVSLMDAHSRRQARFGMAVLGVLAALNGSLVYFCWNAGAQKETG
jgi:hypothetical protein